MSGDRPPRDGTALVEMLYSAPGGPGRQWADGHIETLIQIAAGFQFRETGVVEHLRRD